MMLGINAVHILIKAVIHSNFDCLAFRAWSQVLNFNLSIAIPLDILSSLPISQLPPPSGLNIF